MPWPEELVSHHLKERSSTPPAASVYLSVGYTPISYSSQKLGRGPWRAVISALMHANSSRENGRTLRFVLIMH
jgi:hypothetical protein